MRRKNTGQPLDHMFNKLNKLFNSKTTLKDIETLEQKALCFEPRSEYEKKDQAHLLEQFKDLKAYY